MEKKPITLKDQARELYFEDQLVTLPQVAAKLNLVISTVRTWSFEEGWSVARSLGLTSNLSVDVSDQANVIRSVVFARIMDSGVQMAADDLARLVETWKSLAGYGKAATKINRDDLDDMLQDDK